MTHAGVNAGGQESASLPAFGSLGLSLGRELLGPSERARLEEGGPSLPSPGLGRAGSETRPGLLYLESRGQIDGVNLLDLIGAQYQLLEVPEFPEVLIHQSHLEEEERKLRAAVGEAALERTPRPQEAAMASPPAD